MMYSTRVFPFLLVISCSSTNNFPATNFEKAEVVERIDGKDVDDEVLEWTLGTKPFWETNGRYIFVNSLNVSGNTSENVCFSMSELKAKAEIVGYIKAKVSESGQLVADKNNESAYESLTVFLTNGILSGVKIDERYWEKRLESNAAGERVLRLKCSVKVSVSKEFVANKMIESNKVNENVKEKLIEAQTKAILEN